MAADFISRCPWVVMGPAPALATCLRCEDTCEPPSKAVPFGALEAHVNGFVAVHSACPSGDDEVDPLPEEPARQVDEPARPVPSKPSAPAARKIGEAIWFECPDHGTVRAGLTAKLAKCSKCERSVPRAEVRST